MASTARTKSILPDLFEKLLGLLALLLLGAVVIAVIKGQEHWPRLPVQVWLHLITISIALTLTPVLMLRKRGDKMHRFLGWIWAIAMCVTAAITFTIRYHYQSDINHFGTFSWIHILSVITILSVPLAVYFARKHNISGHRTTIRSIIVGALLTAGFFTFPFNRMLGSWLFS